MDYKQECATMLQILTKTKHVVFTKRCNASILLAFGLAKQLGRSHVLKQDEGGWLTYKKYAEQLDLALTNLVTLDGVLPPKELQNYRSDEILIVNSLAGYTASLDMEAIGTMCVKQDIFLINDVSASIGTPLASEGDCMVGSFGKAKPIHLGTGGFFATNHKEHADIVAEMQEEPELEYDQLYELLRGLDKRRTFLHERVQQVRSDLKDFTLVAPEDKYSLNVIAKFETDEQKKQLIQYCTNNKLEYTECPREIRIDEPAISIEIKRLTS